MLKRLHISNYALIEQLDIEFQSGFTAITGETGAGKSILLGALGLVLGNRADTTVLHKKDSKCMVEASFAIDEHEFESFFSEHDLDFDPETILRREISPQGKSRAFINDSPVNLMQLKEIGSMLVDIHSQHDALHLTDSSFQLSVIDSMADTSELLTEYKSLFNQYKQCQIDLERVRQEAENALKLEEMLSFQYHELEKAQLDPEEPDELQRKINELTHAEDIKTALFQTVSQLNQAEENVVQKVRDSMTVLYKIGNVYPTALTLAQRLDEHLVDIKDIAEEAEKALHQIHYEPDELESYNSRMLQLQTLIQKYRCRDIKELIAKREDINRQLSRIEKSEEEINALSKQLNSLEKQLTSKATQLSRLRSESLLYTETNIVQMLHQLGMPNARFQALLHQSEGFGPNGTDRLEFLFSANKGTYPVEISKVASGGELSRLMLSFKSLLSKQKMIATIIFDEIDTGVSGEVAAKVGRIMSEMSSHVQLIAITHLPQIAGKAQQHLFVFKREDTSRTRTHLTQLNADQRIDEIARMLSDDKITKASRMAAKELIS